MGIGTPMYHSAAPVSISFLQIVSPPSLKEKGFVAQTWKTAADHPFPVVSSCR